MASLLGIGVRAVNNAQLGLLTAQHNISSANTPGFNRQETIQSTSFANSTGSGFIGQGAQIETVRRVYSQYLDNQVLSASTQSKLFDTYYAQMQQIDSVLADPNAGLSPAIQSLFTGVNAVANDPTSVAARQSMLSGAEALVSRFQSLYTRMNELRNGVDTQLETAVTSVNAYATQIADLNRKVFEAQSANNQPPNDLMDQRDQVIAKLNELVKTSVVKQSNGDLSVFIGTGQSLVVGTTAFKLSLRDDPSDLEQKIVGYAFGSTTVTIPSASLENGGVLGGLLSFRRNSLEGAQNALGRVALGLAQSFNNQHQLGQDLNGALGGNFFNIAATSPLIKGNANNTGSLAFTATGIDAAKLTTSNYLVSFDGTTYSLTDSVTNTTTTSLTNAQLLTALSNVGITLTTSGTPASGDQFLIFPTRNGARDISVAITDPNKIAAAAPIRTTATPSNTGSGSINFGSVNISSQPPLNTNIQAPVTITFNSPPTTFNVTGTGTGAPTSVAYTSGADITYNGWTVKISGNPANADTFTIGPNTNGIGDNRNAVALAALQTTNILGSATTTYQGAYTQLVSSVGNKTQEMRINSTAQQTLLDNSKQTQQALSGVNLDEEAANLIRYQQAYQAAAKMIQIGGTLFDTILNIR